MVAQNTYDLQNGFLHSLVQFAHVDVEILDGEFLAVDEQGDILLPEQKCQWPNGAGLVQGIDFKVFRVNLLSGIHVDGHALVLSVHEEWEFMLGRREVDHKESLEGYLKLSAGSAECGDLLQSSPSFVISPSHH